MQRPEAHSAVRRVARGRVRHEGTLPRRAVQARPQGPREDHRGRADADEERAALEKSADAVREPMGAVKAVSSADGQASRLLRAPIDRQEDHHGGHGPHLGRLRDPPHGSAICSGFRGPDADQRLLRTCCTSTGPSCSGRCASFSLVAVVLHVLAAYQLTRQSRRRAPDRLHEARAAGRDARVAHDAVGRRAASRLHRLPHPALHDRQIDPAGWAIVRRAAITTSTATSSRASASGGSRSFYIVAMIALGLHLYHGAWSSVRTLGCAQPSPQPLHRTIALVARRRRVGWHSPSIPLAVVLGIIAMTMRPRRKDSGRPARAEVGQAPLRDEAGEPGEQAEIHGHRRRLGPRRRRRRGDAGRARLQREVLLLPGLAAPRAQHRRAGRHQRREELPERRRQHLPPVLRHDQGRRLPRARRRTSTASRRSASTSSTSASRRACRSRASTAACSPTARSAARRCRARSTRAARPDSSCCSARTRRSRRQIAQGRREDVPARRRCSTSSSIERPRARHRHARPGDRRRSSRTLADAVVLATGGYGNVFYLSTNAQGLERHGDLARVQARRGVRQSVLHADSSDLHSGERRVSVEAHADERVAAQRRPRLGAEESRRQARPPTRFRRPSATTTSSGSIRASAISAPRDIASRAAKEVCDEGRGVGPGGLGVYLDFADAIKRLGKRRDRASATAICSRCTSASRTRIRTKCRCASTRPSTTRWAGSGWTTT